MDKPVNLRQDTWDFLLKELASKVMPSELRLHSSKYLYEAGILDHPHLLRATIIQIDDDTEYRITDEAATALATDDELIILQRLDGEATGVPRTKIISSLINNCEIDQMERGRRSLI